ELRPQRVRHLLVADDDLGDAGGVAQVDERHPTVIPPAVHPPGEGHGGADVGGAELAGVVGAEHGGGPFDGAWRWVLSDRPCYGLPPGARAPAATGWSGCRPTRGPPGRRRRTRAPWRRVRRPRPAPRCARSR